jgi:hypothetical protein
MLIFIDKKAPEQAKETLKKQGEVVEFFTENICYEAISGHPDIFMTQVDGRLIVAPNLPEVFKVLLTEKKIVFSVGEKPVGSKYPETSFYNAVVTGKYLIHQTGQTDDSIQLKCLQKTKISVKQGYTRCNLIAINDKKMITSDQGIHQQLSKNGVETLFVDPRGIVLPTFDHGFFGGTCGISGNKLFITGNLRYFSEGKNVRSFIEDAGMEIVELYKGPLFDGGGIFFVE